MKKTSMLFASILVLALSQVVSAASATSVIASVNRQANTPSGASLVTQRLVTDFGVTDAQVKDLRSKGLSFGEIAIALSLAKEQPGGLTDANIQKVLSLRQTTPHTGWGKVAKQLGVKLGPAVSSVEKLAKESRSEIKKSEEKGETKAEEKAEKAGEKAQHAEKADRVEKAERPEKAERAERPERVERPDRPEKPEAAQGRR
jgi:hypothetical protein